jgi:hypothetical protein
LILLKRQSCSLVRLVRRLLERQRVLVLGLEIGLIQMLSKDQQNFGVLWNWVRVRVPLQAPLTLPPKQRRQVLFVLQKGIAASLCAVDFPARHRASLLAVFESLLLNLPVPMLFVELR